MSRKLPPIAVNAALTVRSALRARSRAEVCSDYAADHHQGG
jgi:hypothetical protein